MAFEPKKITRDHILQGIAKIQEEDLILIPSTRWDVIINGNAYPPKEVMRYAHQEVNGECIWEYSGGEATNKRLRQFGFKIIDKLDHVDPVLDLIERYKEHARKSQLKDELYKWRLVKTFNGRPNTNAPDFTQEITSINFSNLIYQMSNAVVFHIAKERPEELRQAFKYLYNEEIELSERISYFSEQTLKIYREIEPENSNSHHQDERTLATYLAFHDSSNYAFYKDSFYQKYCKLIGVKPEKRGKKLVHYLSLLEDFIRDYIIKDSELLELKKELLTDDCYQDLNHKIFAQDILYATLDQQKGLGRSYWRFNVSDQYTDSWETMEVNQNIAIGWSKIGDLKEHEVQNTKDVLKLLNEHGYNLDDKKSINRNASEIFEFYNGIQIGDIILAQEGANVLGVGEVMGEYNYDSSQTFSHIKSVDWKRTSPDLKNSEGLRNIIYKLSQPDVIHHIDSLLNGYKKEQKMTNELNQILFGPPGTGKTFNLQNSYIPKYTTTEDSITAEQHFTQLVQSLSWWQVIGIALLEENNLKVSDIQLNPWVRKKAELSDSKNIRATLWGTLQMHTVRESSTVNYTQRQAPLIFDKNSDKSWEIFEEEAKEMAPELFEHLDSVNNFKPSPNKSIKRYEFVTFHQSYAYEDFVEGIKPVMTEDVEEQNELKYEIKSGIFKEICKRAENDPDNDYALFIDEINRGNVSQIFGELITLIERDKRKGEKNELSLILPYSRKSFSVPNNLAIIGTMNTADRSVEALDTALRRRFSFIEMAPMPDLIRTVGKLENGIIHGIDLPVLLETMNKRIEKLLDKDHMIGHSYFLSVETLQDLKSAFHNKIIPLFQEYFFGDYGKIGLVIGSKFFDIQDNQVDENFFAPFDDYDSSPLVERKVYHLINIQEMSDNLFVEALNELQRKSN